MIQKVAVVGTGLIGASWALHFLVRGLDVIATDPSDDAESRLRAFVDEHWEQAGRLGLHPCADVARLEFQVDAQRAVERADFVQENGPERVDVKRALFARLDEAAPAHVVLASSSSGLILDRADQLLPGLDAAAVVQARDQLLVELVTAKAAQRNLP